MKKIKFIALCLAVTGCADHQKPVTAIPLAPVTSSVKSIQAHTVSIKEHADKAKIDIAANNSPAANQEIDDIEYDDNQAAQEAITANQQIQDIAKADAAKSAQMVAEQQKIEQLSVQEKNDRWYKTLDLSLLAIGIGILAAYAIYKNFSAIVAVLKLIAL